uniref:hypothetical protein n=1 Tax=Riemerella anatipestifer TaxID=34085 RepID=UPI0030EE6E2F
MRRKVSWLLEQHRSCVKIPSGRKFYARLMEKILLLDGMRWASEWRVLLGFGHCGNGRIWRCGK